MDLTLEGTNEVKKFILLGVLREEAHKQLSYYRQRQDDLIARMATEWPDWGCTLDFYTHLILPLLRNSFILHFINLSEGFSLSDVEIRFGHCVSGDVEFISETLELASSGRDGNADPVDFALYPLTGVTDIRAHSGGGAGVLTLSGLLEAWKLDFKGRHPLPVRIRDADIGAQAFFALLEGIMRNASKHGRSVEVSKSLEIDHQALEAINDIRLGVRYDKENSRLVVTDQLTQQAKEALLQKLGSAGIRDLLLELCDEIQATQPHKTFRVKIVFCDNWESVKKLVQVHEPNLKPVNSPVRYGFVIISINRDLIHERSATEVRERSIGEERLVEFLNKRLNDGVIDDSGKISAGNWGIKEMKICAAFLSGEPLSAVNQMDPGFLLVGKTSGGGIWEDNRERLCYVVRVETPRLAIAIVPKSKFPNNLSEWKGVRFVSSTDDLVQTTTDYDFLFVDEEMREETKSFVEQNLHVLPQRKVIGDFASVNEFEFNCALYDRALFKYLDSLDKKDELNVRVYFQDDTRSAAWERSFREVLNLADNDEIVLELKENGRAKSIKLSFLKESDSRFDFFYQGGYQITLCRHTHLRQLGIVGRTRGLTLSDSFPYYPYYARQVSGADPFFSFVMSIEPERDWLLANLVIRQIIESTLLNVLIVDERIAQSLRGLKAKDEPDISLAEKLYWTGIHVAGSIKIDRTRTIWTTATNDQAPGPDRLVDLSISKEGVIDKTIDDLPIHILLIHTTRLNEIVEGLRSQGLNISKGGFIEKLREQIPYVLVHSGRGKTEGDIPDNTPFVEYSTVEKYVLHEPSKFYLVQIALNVKGERK